MKFIKPFTFPKGFILAIDTREQLPLFESVDGLPFVKKKLDHGDYSIAGFENSFCIERKRISDLTSYVASDRSKTVKKLDAMKDFDWKALVIECEEIELYLPKTFTSVSPEVFRQTLASWSIRYNLHIYCSGDRKMLEMWMLDRAIKYYKVKREG